jgi:hypothetical protein
VTVLFHSLAAFVFGDFRFASFLERTHIGENYVAVGVSRNASIASVKWQTVSLKKRIIILKNVHRNLAGNYYRGEAVRRSGGAKPTRFML